MAKFLVLSFTHTLLPMAWHLRRQGHEVSVLVDRDWYEPAWEGRFRKVLTGRQKSRESDERKGLALVAQRESMTVVTDSRRWAETFAGYPGLVGPVDGLGPQGPEPRVTLGGWFDGEALGAPHLWVSDVGLWPGGQGPQVVGGTTLVRLGDWPSAWVEALDSVADPLKAASFRGPVELVVEWPSGDANDIAPRDVRAGWQGVKGPALWAAAQNLAEALQGDELVLGPRFTVSVPVSLHPWPLRQQGAAVKGGQDVTPHSQGSAIGIGHPGVWWHDVRFPEGGTPQEGRRVETAGTDGLVATVTGSGEGLWTARTGAGVVAGAIATGRPEVQVRGDVAGAVPELLGRLEVGGVVV